ncbi:hypothetical protein ANCDUO_07342 [Ancylostoma duodenale]|uniref:SEA domain protein n=1 Tax=Ancylostoma duodenale TaxID=51022 RepID=A0A0C2GME0_9BILA|nr:hypothetical protein ANCDUO_07342 [Ancylostoma duodenale]
MAFYVPRSLQASTSIRDSTTDVHMSTETTAPPFVTSATTENQEEAATVGVVPGMTHDGSEAEEGHTHEIDVTIDAEVTTPTLDSETTTSELPASSTTEASTSTSTTQATTTTTIDEDAAPFDQDKLSGLFEQDGSFIPEHLTNESSFEPVFPRVELPEESTEIISGPRPKQTTSTSAPELPSFVVDSQPTTVEVHIQDTTPATTTAGTQFTHQLQPIVIQPIVTKTTINEVLQMSRQPEIDSDEGRHLTPVLQTSTEKEAKQEENAPTTTSTAQEASTEATTSPTTQPVPEPTSTASSPVPEPAPEPQGTPQPEPGPQAISAILKTVMGDNFVKFEVESLAKGSVIVNGVIYTHEDITDAEELATKIETLVSSNGSRLGQNEVDSRSITVNGIPSRAYVEHVHSSYPQSSSPSPLLIGSVIAVGVLVILIVAFIVIALNNRRTNGTMKLKDDDLPRMENGKGYSNPQTVSVNLMSYGNGTTTSPPSQGPMVTISPLYAEHAPPPTCHF